jgi:hypothetical protein
LEVEMTVSDELVSVRYTVYYRGTVIYVDTVLVTSPFATAEALARRIIARLDKLAALGRST